MLALLRAAAQHDGTHDGAHDRGGNDADNDATCMPRALAPPQEGFDPAALAYVVSGGLAPLLHRTLGARIEGLPQRQREALIGAALTAMVRHRRLVDTAAELVDLCAERSVPVALLKGISIGERHFDAGHLRPMGDVDILVSPDARRRLEAALQSRGYVPDAGDWSEAAHGAPHRHPETEVWVEVHDRLFAGHQAPCCAMFAPERTAAHLVRSSFRGRPVCVLGDEYQLVYTATYWLRDLSMHAVHPSFAVPLFDAVRLLRNVGDRLDWNSVRSLLGDDVAAASLYVMLSYLDRHRLAPAASRVLPTLALLQRRVGPAELRLLHATLDRYLLGGESPSLGWRTSLLWEALLSPGMPVAKMFTLPWRIAFPPAVPDRYSLRHLLRMARGLRRATRR